jgi:hypothetical protein
MPVKSNLAVRNKRGSMEEKTYTLTVQQTDCSLTYKSTKEGRYASEEENGNVMRQLGPE